MHKPSAPVPAVLDDVSVAVTRTRRLMGARVVVGLGANLGDAVADAARRPSARSPPLDGVTVLAVLARLPHGAGRRPGAARLPQRGGAAGRRRWQPLELLRALQAIELGHGRERLVRWGPRTLDLDVLLWDEEAIDLPDLAVPHPRLVERRFALEPLLDVAPDAVLPGGGRLDAVLARPARAGRRAGACRYHGNRPTTRPGVTTVSHLEDLEEYDAELELSLKREYATVYGLFRYCVLTQEATYLCNKLDLKIEHQPSYPLFHLTMEDVWVWDKNRPSRIIPRADVHTTQDITVEELKPVDDVTTTLPPDFVAPPPEEG